LVSYNTHHTCPSSFHPFVSFRLILPCAFSYPLFSHRPTSTMPILIDGISAATVTFDPSARSSLSLQFRRQLRPGTDSFLVSTATERLGPISFSLVFAISSSSPSDVVLGLDWAAYLRDSLISLGHRLNSSFDAWRFLTEPSCLTANCTPLTL
jgi:hypothetical protein